VLGAEEDMPLVQDEASLIGFGEVTELGSSNGDSEGSILGSIVGLLLSGLHGLLVGSTLGCLLGMELWKALVTALELWSVLKKSCHLFKMKHH
jgi:hypothetical protein